MARRRDSEATAGSILLPSPTHRVPGSRCDLRASSPSVCKGGLTAPEVAVMSASHDRRGVSQGCPARKGSQGSRSSSDELFPLSRLLGLDWGLTSLTKGRTLSATVYSDAFSVLFFLPLLQRLWLSIY